MLVVDDHEGTREVLSVALQLHGFNVETAENGLEALDLLNSHQYQAVLTDFWMPEMNGVELLHEIRARPGLAQLPIILMTAAHGTLPANAADASGFIRKPFDADALLSALAAVDCDPMH